MGGGATKRHKAAVRNPRAPEFLPAWLASALGGGECNSSMPCLQVLLCVCKKSKAIKLKAQQAGGYVHSSLHDYLPKGVSLNMARVTGMPCPLRLCKDPPEVHVHSSNGVFVAVDGEIVYSTCSVCELRGDKHCLTVVEGSERRRHPWVRITEGEYKTVLKAAGKPAPLRCVCALLVRL